MSNFPALLKRVVGGGSLDSSESGVAFAMMMRGEVGETQTAALLTALAMRSPTVEEIAGAVRAMRDAMRRITAPANAMDVCGTGGDGLNTLNISTASAFVVAACGVPVAKHGNRNVSSQTGAADVLLELGIRIELEPLAAEAALAENGFCFLFAPLYHAATRHVAPVRRALGFRTIFNLIGPLSNPASVRRQLIGVFSREWIEPVALVLRELGTEAAWVVHSDDGMDEISPAAPTHLASLSGQTIATREIAPAEAGIAPSPLSAIAGGTARENAIAIRELLSGASSPFRDAVLLNSAAALIVAGKAHDLRAGVATAAEAIDSGRARDVLTRSVAFTDRFGK